MNRNNYQKKGDKNESNETHGSKSNSSSRSKNRSRNRSKSLKKIKNNSNEDEGIITKIKQKRLKITIFDDSKLPSIPSINNHILELEKEKLDKIEYLKKNDMDYEMTNNYLKSIINNEHFLYYYAKFQFLLKYEDRIFFQNIIVSKRHLANEMVLKNLITKQIKDIFKDIGLSIIELYEKTGKPKYEEIREIFINNNVYFEEEFKFKIPNKKGTFEIQYYTLLNDLWYYFKIDLNNNKNLDLKKLINVFLYLKPVFKDLPNMTDEHAISVFDYLINIIYIFKNSGDIDMITFYHIVSSCLTFNKDIANQNFKKMKENIFLSTDLLINNIPAKDYNEDIKGEEMIKLSQNKKIVIETKAKYINWHLINLDLILYSFNFMLCVKYPENCKFNYITMNKDVREGYYNLFDKIIKSKPMKQAMMLDNEARKYQYLFTNDDILNELKDYTKFVCFPFNNYYSYSDKKSLYIYIKANYDFSHLSKTFAIFDNIIRSHYHEYKNISRVYYKMIDNEIELNSPKFNLSQFTDDRKYINDSYNESLKIIKEKSSNYSKNSKCFSKNIDEYGDLVEYAIYGFKVDIQILLAVLFCLDNKSWDLDPETFNENLKYNMKIKTSKFLLNNYVKGFGKIIYDFFDFSTKEDYSLNMIFPIGLNESISDVIETTRFSHHINRK